MRRSSVRRARGGEAPARAGHAHSARRVARTGRARSARGGAPTGAGRLSTEFCRLCHGKFSTRRLRQAFGRPPGDAGETGDTSEDVERSSPRFCSDFQLLLGVPMQRDPSLSQYICKNCHAQFYKCHSILLTFREKVNVTPSYRENDTPISSKWPSRQDVNPSSLPIISDRSCLHSLVSWAHQHAEGCRSCPALQEVLEGQCFGSVKAMWSCVDGHSYTMDTGTSRPQDDTRPNSSVPSDGEKHNHTLHQPAPHQPVSSSGSRPTHTGTAGTQSSAQSRTHSASSEGTVCGDGVLSPVQTLAAGRPEESDLSDRNYSSEDEDFEDKRKSVSSDDSADVYTEKRVRKRGSKEVKTLEPKVRRKPGPKPGWKKKIKSEREELPTIYKCPHQGCTAVYRGADGMKKHIKEHHEEVRERPCPHPGCNKVFMIDRYLQRHVKLIHTEVRNYICDQCGQTFKQRKHLSVHQMRHSGAKPLQCEVCGFQCRQRASLKYHMTKHKAEADLEFACALCGRRFEKAHNLNVHMSMVHPLMQGGSISLPSDPDNQNLKHSDSIDHTITPAPTHTQTHTDTEDMSCVLHSLHS